MPGGVRAWEPLLVVVGGGPRGSDTPYPPELETRPVLCLYTVVKTDRRDRPKLLCNRCRLLPHCPRLFSDRRQLRSNCRQLPNRRRLFFTLGSSKIEVCETYFYDIVTAHNDHPSYVKHFLGCICVFFTLFLGIVCVGGVSQGQFGAPPAAHCTAPQVAGGRGSVG